jgi:hypothetical protein
MTDAQLRAALEEKLKVLKEDMAKAKAAGHTEVRAPDGSIIQIHPDSGPCLSAAVDKTTGKVYYGRNQDGRPDPMHPTLDANADRAADLNMRHGSAGPGMPPTGLANKGIPGDHSEVNAVNNGMLDREEARKQDPSLPPPKTEDFAVVNQSPDGKPMPCCRNCKITTGQDFNEKQTKGSQERGENPKVEFVPNTGARDVSQAE